MRYACADLGEQRAGTAVTVRLTGSVSNVILIDRTNFARYRAGQGFLYEGGHFRQSPVHLEVPEDGHWYVVVDLGGYRGRVNANVEVESADGASEPAPHRTLLVT
jgi:hypothetical protein